MDASLPPYPIAIKRSTIKRSKDSVGADRTCFQHVGFQGSPHVSSCSILEFRIPDVKESTLGSARPLVPHDFDMARFGFGEEPVGVSAMAGNLFDVRAERAGDWDTAMVLLRMRSGALCHINCSRLCAYGYDQRVEAFGEQGMLASCNPTPNSLARHTAAGTSMRGRLHYFFIERCAYLLPPGDRRVRRHRGDRCAALPRPRGRQTSPAAGKRRARGRSERQDGQKPGLTRERQSSSAPGTEAVT